TSGSPDVNADYIAVLVIVLRPPHNSTLFPYTTLFRSGVADEPTIGTLAGAYFVYVANSQWEKYTDDGKRKPEVKLTAPVLLSLRSEEHTSELQSRGQLVCRLLLEKKNTRLRRARERRR